jgi:hypothetical protein
MLKPALLPRDANARKSLILLAGFDETKPLCKYANENAFIGDRDDTKKFLSLQTSNIKPETKLVDAGRDLLNIYGGTRLGLSICKKLVELMGGTIHCSSSKGEGSSFWIELASA